MALRAATCDDEAVPKTVLIVDDHPSFRASARTLLEAEGFSVVDEAADGAEAIAKTKELRPDLVLLEAGNLGEAERDVQKNRLIRRQL